MSKQPVWKFIANLGDANPIEHGGYFIFEDLTGVYSPEGEVWNPDEMKAYRIMLDKVESVEDEWFGDKIDDVSKCVDFQNIEECITGENILDRARAYEAIGLYYGFVNFDNYPLELTMEEAQERYKDFS